MKLKRSSWRRAAAMLGFGAAGLCTVCLAATVLLNAVLPIHSSDPTTLSAVTLAQLAEVERLRAGPGEQVWPGSAAVDVPFLVWNEQLAFLCGVDAAPPGWDEVPSVTFDGRPCARQPWPDGQAFIERVGSRWAGSFATQEYYDIRLPQEIRAQLPPIVRPVFPAFLISLGMRDSERYLGAWVHESFHAVQATLAPGRFTDAERSYAAEARYWDQNQAAREAFQAEVNVLYAALQAGSDQEARDEARRFLALRAERRSAYLSGDRELEAYEQRTEWLEGLAKYVELSTLRLAGQGEYQPAPGMAGDPRFRGYRQMDRLYRQEIDQLKRLELNFGSSSLYYTGMAQALLLDRFDPTWKQRAFGAGVWLEDLLAQAVE